MIYFLFKTNLKIKTALEFGIGNDQKGLLLSLKCSRAVFYFKGGLT